MLFYFDFSTYFRMLRLAWGEQNPRNRRKLITTLLLRVPLVAIVHSVCFFLDPIVFPGLRRTEVRAPVFVVGHARSGTTLLHRLMSADDNFSVFLLWELWFPSLLEKKAVRALAAVDRRLLGGALARRVHAWEERKFGKTQHIHFQSLTVPEEDDAVLADSCASGQWIVSLPYMGKLDFYYVDEWPVRRRRRLMRFYKECVRRQLYLNGGEKVHLSKNPTFAGRIETLIETFPDARFVVPFRNPYETIPSLLKLLQVAWRMRKWSDVEMQQSLRIVAEQSYHTYTYPLEALERHPETKYAIVDYAALVAEPKRVVEEVCAQLGIRVGPELERALVVQQSKARKHETAHTYSLEEFGLRADDIHEHLRDLFERFHWETGEGSVVP